MKAILSLAILTTLAATGCQTDSSRFWATNAPYEPHTVVPEYLKDDKNRLLSYDKAAENGRAQPYLSQGDYSPFYNAQTRYMNDGATRADYRQQDAITTHDRHHKHDMADNKTTDLNKNNRYTVANAPLAAADRQFILDATSGGLFEVRSSELAVKKTTSDKVKALANHIINDHQRANSDMLNLTKAKNIDVPTTLNTKHQAMLDELTKLDGAAFDEAYLRQQRTAHDEAIGLYETAARGATDNDLKNFAQSKIDILRQHARMIDDTNRTIITTDR